MKCSALMANALSAQAPQLLAHQLGRFAAHHGAGRAHRRCWTSNWPSLTWQPSPTSTFLTMSPFRCWTVLRFVSIATCSWLGTPSSSGANAAHSKNPPKPMAQAHKPMRMALLFIQSAYCRFQRFCKFPVMPIDSRTSVFGSLLCRSLVVLLPAFVAYSDGVPVSKPGQCGLDQNEHQGQNIQPGV